MCERVYIYSYVCVCVCVCSIYLLCCITIQKRYNLGRDCTVLQVCLCVCVCVCVCAHTCDGRQQTADSRQQTADSRQQAAGSRQQAAGSRQQAAGSRQQTADSLPAFPHLLHGLRGAGKDQGLRPLSLGTNRVETHQELHEFPSLSQRARVGLVLSRVKSCESSVSLLQVSCWCRVSTIFLW
jgi:hypothetical protein